MAAPSKELERLVVRIVGDGTHYTKTLNKAVKDTADAVNKINTGVGNMLAAAGRGIHNAGMRLKSVGQTMGIYGTLITVSLTVPILGAAAAMIKLASSAETTRKQFEVMLGKGVGTKMLADIKKMGAETPFEFPELAASARTLIGFGVETDKVLGTLQMMGDVAAGTDSDMQRLATIYGQILGMGRLQGQDFLQLLNANFPIEQLAKTVGMGMSEFREAMEDGRVPAEVVTETFRRLTSEGGKYYDMMKVLSESPAGKFSNLMDGAKELAVTMGEYLLPTVKYVLDVVIAGVKWFKGLGEEVHKTVMFVAALVGGVGPLLIGLGTIATVLGVMGTSLVGIVTAGAGALAVIIAIAGGIYLLVKGIQMMVDNIYGEGAFIGAIKDALLAVWNFAQKSLGFLLNIRTNWGLLTEWLSANWGNMLKDLGMMWWVGFQNMIKNVIVIIQTMIRLWLLWQGFMVHLFKQLFTAEFIDCLLTGIIEAIGILVRFVDSAWNTIKNLFTGGGTNELASLAGELGERLGHDMKTGMEGNFMTGAGAILKEQAGKMTRPLEGFESSTTALPEFVTNITAPVKEAEKDVKKADPKLKVMELEKKKEKEKEKEEKPEETRTGEFKQISLRRFAVNPVGQNNGPKKQEVTDKGVQDKLGEVVDAIKGKDNTAVMAR